MCKQLSILFLLLALTVNAIAQNLNNQKPEYFSVKNGLPDATITAICQDSDGFLWIGTSYGLSRYDGVDFVNYYHAKHSVSLPGNYINKLILLSGHRLLVATTTGLCLFNTRSNTFKSVVIKSEAAMFGFENNFRTVSIDKNGHIWAGTQTNLYELDTALNILQQKNNGSRKGTGPNVLLYVDGIRSLPDGNVIFKTQQSDGESPYHWYLSEAKGITPIDRSTVPYRSFLDPVVLKDFVFDRRGNAYYIKRGADSLFYFDVQTKKVTARPFEKVKGRSQISFNSQLSIINDQFLACSLFDGGLLYTNRLHDFATNHEPKWDIVLPGKHVTCVFCDRENNIWIGTTSGLFKFTMALNDIVLSALPEKDTQGEHNIELSNIFLVSRHIFLTTTSGGLFYSADHEISWKNLTWPAGGELNSTWNVRATGGDQYWIATQKGLFEWKYGNKQAAPVLLPAAWQWINKLPITTQFLDRENTLWLGLGAGRGVAAFNLTTRQVKLYTRETGHSFPLRYPVAIDEDEYGNLWMGGVEGRGLARWDRRQDKFTLFSPQLNSEFDNGIINAVYADHKGSLWLGTSDGLFQFGITTRQFKKYSVQQGLASNFINSIGADSSKRLWIGTKNGLSCMDLNSQKIFNFDGYYQNSEDGVNCVTYDAANHRIYFITPHNFYSIAPQEWLRRREPPPLFITSVVSSGKNLSPDQKIGLDYNNNNINIAFSAINLVDGGQTKYFYRLNSRQKNWVPAGNSRQVSFSSLLPGQYAFEVKAQLPDGSWSKNRGIVLFSVANPFWKTWWFILLNAVAVTLVIYLFYRYRINQVIALQNIRSRIASDLHDEIGSTLSNIHILTQLSHANIGQPETARGFLSRIAEEVNTSSQSLDDIVWSINTLNDNFEQVAARMRRYAAELFESSDIDYKVDIDEKLLHKKLDLEQRRDIYLIFREAVNNIYKHAQATTATVSLETDHNFFKMIVKDNGLGFDPRKPTARNGLKNMEARVKANKGSFAVESKPGGGVTLSIVMKLFR